MGAGCSGDLSFRIILDIVLECGSFLNREAFTRDDTAIGCQWNSAYQTA
jgi:hypothetical protein